MKHLTFVLFLTVALFACSDDSTGPEKNSGGTGPVASETIGTAGGMITADDITLTVPSGSFGDDTTIGISKTTENGYGDNAASGTFLLSGIPGDFTAPLTLTVAYTGELANGTYLVVEEVATDPLTGEPVRIPRFIAATATNDSVTGVLPARAGMAIQKSTDTSDGKNLLDFYITVVTDYIEEQSASHFIIHVPHYANDIATALHPHLDQMYDRIAGLGFDFSLPGNAFGALDTINVYTDDDIADPPLFENLWTKDMFGAYMEIDDAYFGSEHLDWLKFDAIRSLATLTALYYTQENRKPTLWFDIAMADWLAREWHNTDMIPSTVPTDPSSVLKGIPLIGNIERNTLETYLSDSRRFAPLFSYLDSEYNFTGAEHTLAKIYEERYNGADLATSIETVTGLEPSAWWPDFIEAYITGQVWDIDPQVFLGSSARKGFTTLTQADSAHIFSGEFGDLAADIYMVTLDATYAETIGSLQFTAESSGLQDEYLTVLLFGVRNNKPYYIGRGIDSVIADAGEASESDTFLAVVASSLIDYPYRDDVPYSLTVTGTSTGEYSELVLQLPYVWRSQELVKPDGTIENAGGSGGIITWSLLDFEKNGDTYTGTKITTANSDFWGHYKKTATITATITSTMASANITQVTEDYDYNTVTTETFVFWNLPLIETAEYYLISYGSTLEQYLSEEHWPYFTYTLYTESHEIPSAYYREREYYARGANIHLR